MSSPTRLIFCHGFGLDPRFWDPLRPFLQVFDLSFMDLGYFGPPVLPDLSCRPKSPGERWVGVGHSLGLLKLLSQHWPLDGVMGLNGFVDFLGHAPVLRARRMAEWQTLLAHFHRNPRATLENFYKRCGVASCAPESPGLQMERASGDLVFLKTPLLPPRHTPLLLLGAGDDVVVPREVLEDNVNHLQAQGYKAVRLHLLPHGSHGLGARHPEEVTSLLKEFIHGLP